MFGYRGGVDGEVLAELRAIRREIQGLSERVADSATREDLKGYVTQQAFDEHLAGETTRKAGWRWWAAFGLSVVAALLSMHASGLRLVW